MTFDDEKLPIRPLKDEARSFSLTRVLALMLAGLALVFCLTKSAKECYNNGLPDPLGLSFICLAIALNVTEIASAVFNRRRPTRTRELNPWCLLFLDLVAWMGLFAWGIVLFVTVGAGRCASTYNVGIGYGLMLVLCALAHVFLFIQDWKRLRDRKRDRKDYEMALQAEYAARAAIPSTSVTPPSPDKVV